MAVLCLLPLSGPLVGLACGIGVRELYLGTPAAALSLVTGLVLAGFALWWSRRILRGAA
jgi:tight adherence protein B